MKWVILVLVLLLGFLQYRLWVGEGSLAQIAELKRDIAQQQMENNHLRSRNQALAAEIEALKTGSSVEDRARRDMGMIRKDETFVLIVDEQEKTKNDKPR
ncbi:MAG TPA: cell division protein FtsB [Pseudomonadales bacterium]|jgi:cell division protein FtsB|nr:cell division protein FtsB [Pseudomonadales bacterium]HNI37129.1 cell division protein FtsB [Pseudomonadales bacterium]HNL91708.1 cell division protein FtsB [Pseudomonadales bacterium]HNN86101.1 cell division protein FtsB [Pseudomonadales bacterium]